MLQIIGISLFESVWIFFGGIVSNKGNIVLSKAWKAYTWETGACDLSGGL